MTIHFFTKGDKGVASSRYRGYYLAEGLIAAGEHADVHPISADFLSTNTYPENLRLFYKYFKLLISYREKDEVIFLQRTVYNKYFLLAVLLARLIWQRKYIFDIDDAVFEHSFVKTWLLVKLASAVTCGSTFIFEWVKKRNKNAFYFLNSIPPDIYAPRHAHGSDIPVIGWIGDGPAHFENLKLLPSIFNQLIRDGLHFKFRLVGALGDKQIYDLLASVKGLDYTIVDKLDWSDPRHAAREIGQFDIGIMPMADNHWNKAKYFKTLEYMACGVPALAPDFGENRSIIEDGKSGFLLKNTEGWHEALKALISKKDIRMKMGERALKIIHERFTLDQAVKRLIGIISEVIS